MYANSTIQPDSMHHNISVRPSRARELKKRGVIGVIDTGSTAFMLICTAMVFLMTPALAFFYGGLSRRKNVVNTMFMSMIVIALVGVVWAVAGWSIAYGGDGTNPIIGGLDQLFLGSTIQLMETAASETKSYPLIIDVANQAAFAMITVAIITGSLAGRMKFSAVMLFTGFWALLVYPPLAHMVWGGEHSLIGGMIGALDFAGGDVVHISSGVTGLLLCRMLGTRREYGMFSYRPHNVPFVVLGTGLLWFGWFGFNAGSAFAADKVAGLAFLTTLLAPTTAMLSWMLVEWRATGKATLVGACTGVLAGLVVITPSAGFVSPVAALLMGAIVSPICYWAIAKIKPHFGYDDALDAFGLHGVGGIVGGVLTGIFTIPELSPNGLGGLAYTADPELLIRQVAGILVTLVFVIAIDFVLIHLVNALCGGRFAVDECIESEGLDAALHGESAYPAFNGLD